MYVLLLLSLSLSFPLTETSLLQFRPVPRQMQMSSSQLSEIQPHTCTKYKDSILEGKRSGCTCTCIISHRNKANPTNDVHVQVHVGLYEIHFRWIEHKMDNTTTVHMYNVLVHVHTYSTCTCITFLKIPKPFLMYMCACCLALWLMPWYQSEVNSDQN